MKKFLALFLVLAMMLSVALVACSDTTTTSGNNNNDIENNDDDDLGFVSKDTGDDETGDETDDKGNVENSGWEAATYKIYAMANGLNIRKEPSLSKNVEKLGQVDVGTELTALERNDEWYKISYNGTTAYVNREYVTLSKDEATFTTDAEPTVLKIQQNDANDDMLNLRTDPSIPDDNATYALDIKYDNTKDGQLKKVGQNASGTWYVVEYDADGSGDGVAKTYYIKINSETSRILGLSSTPGGRG